MATSKVSSPLSFGTQSNISSELPFTVPHDGFIKVLADPSAASSAYVIYKSSTQGNYRVNSFGGFAQENLFVTRKGDVITYVGSGGVKGYGIYYTPINGM